MLAEEDLRARDLFDFKADRELFVEASGFQVFEADAAHDEGDARVAQQVGLIVPDRAQPFGAATFEKLEVVRVIDDATGVGVFVIDANGDRESVRLLLVLHGGMIVP